MLDPHILANLGAALFAPAVAVAALVALDTAGVAPTAGTTAIAAASGAASVLAADRLRRLVRRTASRGGRPTRQTPAGPSTNKLERDLRRSIERDELVLHYQPQGDLRTGSITGAEALVRWNHPRLGLLAPEHFIPLAEESGFILELGEWVLERACEQAARWQDLAPADFAVAVNLSPRQFELQQVDDVVASVLSRTGLPSHRLELEVTERLALHEPGEVTATLSRLREMGVRCSIDDFGTGYSALSYLDRLPVSGLKIDKTFVQSITSLSTAAPVVRAVIALARDLGLDVVAEGVETEPQLAFLLSHGCDHVQGFLLGRPVPATEFEVLLMLERVTTAPEGLGATPVLRH
jgi:EAL domain-containing protein (putative c-di-GMP-specific phosphodiesterase class I)